MRSRLETGMSEEARAKLADLALANGLVLKMGKTPGKPALGQMLEVLIFAAWDKIVEQPTLYTLAQTEPETTRARILSALLVYQGDAVKARLALGSAIGRTQDISERDWRRARDYLGLQDNVKKRAGKTGGKD